MLEDVLTTFDQHEHLPSLASRVSIKKDLKFKPFLSKFCVQKFKVQRKFVDKFRTKKLGFQKISSQKELWVKNIQVKKKIGLKKLVPKDIWSK